jgi:hypothetical protein
VIEQQKWFLRKVKAADRKGISARFVKSEDYSLDLMLHGLNLKAQNREKIEISIIVRLFVMILLSVIENEANQSTQHSQSKKPSIHSAKSEKNPRYGSDSQMHRRNVMTDAAMRHGSFVEL